MIGTSTFEPASPKEYPQPEETQREELYTCEIDDLRLGGPDGLILSVGMHIFFPTEIEEYPHPTLTMYYTVDLERPPEDEFISFDNVTIDMIKEWARIHGDLENIVIEHRERIRTMTVSSNPSPDSDS